MKTTTTVLMATVAIVVAGLANAGEVAQQVAPFAAYQNTEDMDNGYGGGLKYAVTYDGLMPHLDVGVDVRAAWLTFSEDDNDYGVDLDMVPIELTFLARYEVLDGSKPYVGVGVGYYFFDSDEIDIDDELGCYGIVGWNQKVMEHLSVFAEAKYLLLEPDVNGVASTADIDLSGVGANIGIAMDW